MRPQWISTIQRGTCFMATSDNVTAELLTGPVLVLGPDTILWLEVLPRDSVLDPVLGSKGDLIRGGVEPDVCQVDLLTEDGGPLTDGHVLPRAFIVAHPGAVMQLLNGLLTDLADVLVVDTRRIDGLRALSQGRGGKQSKYNQSSHRNLLFNGFCVSDAPIIHYYRPGATGKLKEKAPEVVKRMGFNYGGKIDKMMGGGMVMKEKMKMMGGGHSKDKMKMMGGGYGKDYMKKKMRMGGKIRYGHGGTTSCPINGMVKRGRTKGKMV